MSDDDILTEPGIDLRITCSAFPTQVEGTVDGREVYFRARHGAWEFTVYNRTCDGDTSYWCVDGEDPHMGNMPPADVWPLLRSLVEQWRGGARTVLG